MFELDFFDELDRFSFMVRKRVSTIYKGARSSLSHGIGTEVMSFREYSQGDDIRLIDWKAYARTEKLFVKEYEEERSAITYVLLDSSRSMGFGNPHTKFEYGAMIAAGICYLVTKENEKFAISTFSEGARLTPPKKGISHLLSTVTDLEDVDISGKTELLKSVNQLASTLKSRSVVIIISDFLLDEEEIKEALLKLSRHEVVAIQVLLPEELKPDMYGNLELVDSETGERIELYATPASMEKQRIKIEEWKGTVERISFETGVQLFSFSTDEPVFESLVRVLTER
ncbi:MAG: DUF58 domain-containing protein [Methermicoccaceae archaeon]